MPRAFACDYTLVQSWLLRIGGGFRNHSCLTRTPAPQLYVPSGQTLVLQPSESAAAQHAMLPAGSGLWKVVDPEEAGGLPWSALGRAGEQSAVG